VLPYLLYLPLPYLLLCAYANDTVLNACLGFRLSVHMYLPLHATWHASYHSLGSFLTPLDVHVQISELGLTCILLLRTKLTLWSRQTRYGSSPLFCPPFGSWHLLVAHEQVL